MQFFPHWHVNGSLCPSNELVFGLYSVKILYQQLFFLATQTSACFHLYILLVNLSWVIQWTQMEIVKFSISEAYRQHLWDWDHCTNINILDFWLKKENIYIQIWKAINQLQLFCKLSWHTSRVFSCNCLVIVFSSFFQINISKNAFIGRHILL